MISLDELDRLEKEGSVAIAAAIGTDDLSYERASAFGIESHFREQLAVWYRSGGREMVRDGERYRWLRARGCFQVDWDDGEPGEMVVLEITGSINDREYEEVAKGESLDAMVDTAIDSARRTSGDERG